MFYLTKEEREIFEGIAETWRIFWKHPIKYTLGLLFGYIYMVLIIGVFG